MDAFPVGAEAQHRHISPRLPREAHCSSPRGNLIEIDIPGKKLNVLIAEEELKKGSPMDCTKKELKAT